MKKLVAIFLITLSATAMAQHHHHRHGGHYGGPGWGWITPAIIGGTVVYAMTRPPVVVQQPPVVVQQPSDVVYIDGFAYRKQWILINGSYQEVLVRI
jgi:hypothetical protein